MKRIACTLLLACCMFGAGCSKPTAEAPTAASPTPQKPEAEIQKEQVVKADAVEAHTMKMVPAADQPIMAVSPSPSASAPRP